MKIYLASTFRPRDRRGDELLDFRDSLRRRALRKFQISLALGEADDNVILAGSVDDQPGVLESCARLIGQCDAFFGILFGRHGSKIQLESSADSTAAVSFFEAEFLAASMSRKPICIVKVRGFEPNDLLKEFLNLVDGSLKQHIVEADRGEIPQILDDFCRALGDRSCPQTPWLFDRVSIGRVRRNLWQEQLHPQLKFLGGMLRCDGGGTANETALRASLRRLKGRSDTNSEPFSQLEILSYLWAAIRELARTSVNERIHDFSHETQFVLAQWNKAAAWHGLHGSHPMGCLAAINDLQDFNQTAETDETQDESRSSAYYSIGVRAHESAIARQFFLQSLNIAQSALRCKRGDPSGHLQMTASAHARLAMLGSRDRWRFALALRDYRASLKWRIKHGASAGAVGEAMNAYAYALSRLPFRTREALRLAAEGASMMKAIENGRVNGFYVRAERKRADMLLRARRFDEGLEVAGAAHTLAVKGQQFDQAIPLSELITELNIGLGRPTSEQI